MSTAGYVVKQEDGRRNRYQIQAHLPLPETTSQQHAIGEVPAQTVEFIAHSVKIYSGGGEIPHH